MVLYKFLKYEVFHSRLGANAKNGSHESEDKAGPQEEGGL